MKFRMHPLFAIFSILGLLVLVGCQSGRQPGSNSHASTTIKGRTDQEIRQAVRAVLAEDGYSFVTEGHDFMGFQRPGSRSDAIKWGGWYGEGVVVRGKLKMTTLADESRLLQLDMYAVRDAGDAFFEEENRMMMLNKAPYRALLRKVEKQLASNQK